MYAAAIAAVLVAPAQPPAKHEDQNSLYKTLLDTGVPVGGEKVKLPPPTMPDGLAAAKQTDVIKELIKGKYDYDEFTRNTVVAAQKIEITDLKPADPKKADPKVQVRRVDVWFVVYGDFKRLEDDKFLDRLGGSTRGTGGKSVEIKEEHLKARNIPVPDKKREGYGHIEFDFLEKVRLKVTGHAMWSRGAESVVATAEIDPRFEKDKDFPNQWRPINKDGTAGEANAWSGAAMYLKITKLQQPAGALFIEQHVVYSEPSGWFDGTNQLRAKLPIAVQENVRNMRKEFQKK
jgi:hypothetical protein